MTDVPFIRSGTGSTPAEGGCKEVHHDKCPSCGAGPGRIASLNTAIDDLGEGYLAPEIDDALNDTLAEKEREPATPFRDAFWDRLEPGSRPPALAPEEPKSDE